MARRRARHRHHLRAASGSRAVAWRWSCLERARSAASDHDHALLTATWTGLSRDDRRGQGREPIARRAYPIAAELAMESSVDLTGLREEGELVSRLERAVQAK